MTDDNIPGLGPPAVRPLANPNVDLTTLLLSPVEGFVLSRVDGRTSYREICAVSGLPQKDVEQMLRKFKQAGLIMNPGEQAPPPTPSSSRRSSSVPPASATSRNERNAGLDARERQPSSPQRPSLLERLDDRSPVDPAELVGAPDMDATTKARIIRLHRRIGKLSAAEIFGTEAMTDAKALRNAYFQASKELHPDRYYGKDIGIFRERLEQVFRRLSELFAEINDLHKHKRK